MEWNGMNIFQSEVHAILYRCRPAKVLAEPALLRGIFAGLGCVGQFFNGSNTFAIALAAVVYFRKLGVHRISHMYVKKGV